MSAGSTTGAKGRRGGAFRADGVTPRRLPSRAPDDASDRKKRQDATRRAEQVTVGLDPDAKLTWEQLGKPAGTFNRWLVGLARAEAAQIDTEAVPGAAQVEIAQAALERHKQRPSKNKRIQCKNILCSIMITF